TEEGLRAVLERYSHDPAQGKVEYFPASRTIPFFPPFGGLGTGEQRMARAARDGRKYSFIVPFLRTLEHNPKHAEAFAARLAALSPSCRYVPGPSPDVFPRCLSSRGGPTVLPSELSDGEADAVIFAATAVAIGLDHSILFVDRPDLHLENIEQII